MANARSRLYKKSRYIPDLQSVSHLECETSFIQIKLCREKDTYRLWQVMYASFHGHALECKTQASGLLLGSMVLSSGSISRSYVAYPFFKLTVKFSFWLQPTSWWLK